MEDIQDEITYPHGIIKVEDKFVLKVKVYGLFYVTYSSRSLVLLIKYYENNKRCFELKKGYLNGRYNINDFNMDG